MRAIRQELQEVGEELQVVGNQVRHEIHAKANSLKIISLIVIILLSGCSNDQNEFNSFLNEKLVCPAPAVAEFEGWGKSGMQQSCKIKHGPFVAWEGGYVHIRGQYENGKEAGIWYWYNKNGSVEKKIDYSKPSSDNATKKW
jgi:hypothetical protein